MATYRKLSLTDRFSRIEHTIALVESGDYVTGSNDWTGDNKPQFHFVSLSSPS